MTPTPPPSGDIQRTRGRRWWRLLLFVSLALNLAVAGIVGGAVLKFRRDAADRPELISRELGLGPYLFAMDREQRTALHTAAGEHRETWRANRRAWIQAFEESLAVLRAEPFDAARFQQLVVEQAELASGGRRVGQEVLTAQVSAMTPEARQAFADRLEQGRFQRHDRGDRGPKDRPPGPPPHGPDVPPAGPPPLQ